LNPKSEAYAFGQTAFEADRWTGSPTRLFAMT
jgi:hypothetical protein